MKIKRQVDGPADAAAEHQVIPVTKQLSPTEQQNPSSSSLSSMSLTDSIHLMLNEEINALHQIRNHGETIEKLISKAVDCISSGGRVLYIGAGTSGRLAAIDAVECQSTFDSSSVIALLAGGSKAMSTSMDEAEQSFQSGVDDAMEQRLSPRDLVIGISASGQTPYLWGGLSVARLAASFVALITFNPHLQFRSFTPDLLIALSVGPEVLTGSTRLKCGTTTKCLLNMISMLTMVKLGRTYDNLMISVHPGNRKLKERLARIVCSLVPAVDERMALQALQDCDFDLKKAVQLLAEGE